MANPAFSRWSARPPEWDAAAALTDPLSWLDLAPWPRSLADLRRGAQVGKPESRRVWACGLTRYPHDAGNVRVARAAVASEGAFALILPGAWSALIRACPEPLRLSAGAVARPLAARGFLVQAGAVSMTYPYVLPGSGGVRVPLFAVRAELSLLDDDSLNRVHPAVRALALLLRPRFAGWFEGHDPVELVPRPDLAVAGAPRALQREGGRMGLNRKSAPRPAARAQMTLI